MGGRWRWKGILKEREKFAIRSTSQRLQGWSRWQKKSLQPNVVFKMVLISVIIISIVVIIPKKSIPSKRRGLLPREWTEAKVESTIRLRLPPSLITWRSIMLELKSPREEHLAKFDLPPQHCATGCLQDLCWRCPSPQQCGCLDKKKKYILAPWRVRC